MQILKWNDEEKEIEKASEVVRTSWQIGICMISMLMIEVQLSENATRIC